MADDPRETVKRYAEKLEIESIPAYAKLILGREVALEALSPEDCKKLANAMKAKAVRVGVNLEGGSGRKGGGDASEKQLRYIEVLVSKGRITPAQLTGYIKDVDPGASIPEDLTKRTASALIDRLAGLAGEPKRNREDLF